MPLPRTPEERVEEMLSHPTMILCSCHRIPARAVMKAVGEEPTEDVERLMELCGAGGGCRCCAEDISRLACALLKGSRN
jgi:NAD(P)H-nitrite reductase large subunit